MKDFEDLKRSLVDFFDNNRSKKYTLEELIKLFEITNSEKDLFLNALLKLQLDEKILLNKHNEYVIFPTDSDLKVGTLKYFDGKYYVNDGNKRLYISPKHLNKAIVNDKILYQVQTYEMTTYAVIKGVITRKSDCYLFDVKETNGKKSLIPYFAGFNYKLDIKEKDLDGLVDGSRVLIKLSDKDEISKYGNLVSIIGHKDDPDFLVKTIAAEMGIKIDFDCESKKEVLSVKKCVTEEDLKDRVDFRDRIIFTIDGADTKDMDDAISLDVDKDGNYVLGVHIADVSHYIKPGMSLYNEAKIRGNSYYPANYVIPMFPHELSNGICSLNPNTDRLCLSVMTIISKKGKILYSTICESVINSNKKMSYEDVNKVLNGEMVSGYEKYYDTLKKMEELHNLLDIEKIKRGYINFGDHEIKTEINDDNVTFDRENRGVGEKLIEDFMLIANNQVTEYVKYLNVPFVYRCEEKPDKFVLRETLQTMKEMGVNLTTHKALDTNYALQELLGQLDDIPEKEIYQQMLLQSMKRADYRTLNIGHFGLALNDYTHFTSPIRRFSDLTVHLLLKDYLNGIYPEDSDNLDDELNIIARHCSQTDKLSDEFEREVNKQLMIKYMEQHMSDEFTAVVSNVGNNHITVRLTNGIYGRINVCDLDRKYKFNSKEKYLYSGKDSIKINGKLQVMLDNIDRTNGKVYFTITTPLVRKKS